MDAEMPVTFGQMGPDPHGARKDRIFAVMGNAFDLRMSFYIIFRVALDKTLYLVLVFVDAESTGGINDGTAVFKAFVGSLKDRFLQRDTDLRTIVHIALDSARIPSEHTLA